MFTTNMTQPDPGAFMRQFLSSEAASKANKWTRAATAPAGRTPITTMLYHASENELDPVKRAALFIAMNDMRDQ